MEDVRGVAAGLESRGEQAQLALDLAQPRGQPIPLVPERPRERDDDLDEAPFPFLDAPKGRGKDFDRQARGTDPGHSDVPQNSKKGARFQCVVRRGLRAQRFGRRVRAVTLAPGTVGAGDTSAPV
jgi:hypothetical protein